MIVTARHPMAEGVKQLAGQRQDRWIEVLFPRAQQRVKIFAGLAVADVQQPLEVIEARAPYFDLLGGQYLPRAQMMRLSGFE
jgi:hypothetical protein